MYRIIVALSFFVVACQDHRAPIEPMDRAVEDEVIQLADRQGGAPALSPEQIDGLWAAAKATDFHSRNMEAWLEPYTGDAFWGLPIADIGKWHTFTVKTRSGSGIDSVYAMVNMRHAFHERAFEVAGGTNPPSRSFCPPEVNDGPSRARRDGWNIHFQTCRDELRQTTVDGTWFNEDDSKTYDAYVADTMYLLYGLEDGQLVVYGLGNLHAAYYDKK